MHDFDKGSRDFGNLDKSIEGILEKITVDKDHDIPYLAGYSEDGGTIYIDRHLKTKWNNVDVTKYLVMHEVVEKSLIDELGLTYELAHYIATAAEQELVEYDGIKWDAYEKYMDKYIKTAASEQLTKIPDDLDLTPYSGKLLKALVARM